MDAYAIISVVSGVLVAVVGPILGYVIKQRDTEAAELKREVADLREKLQDAQLAAAGRDTRLAVLEARVETLDHVVTRSEFEGAMKELRGDIREIKDYVMPSPQRGRYGTRFPSSDSLPAQKDPKDR